MLNRISFEENADRTKITIPLQRQWGFWLTYTILLLVWLTSTLWAIVTLFNTLSTGNYPFEGAYLFAWLVMLAIIGGLWWYLGRNVWRRWQYYTANREILFFYPDKLVVRRPLSLLGLTDAYDLQHVSLFRYDGKIDSLAFDYGTHRIPVGLTLPKEEAQALLSYLNSHFFTEHVANDDDLYG